MAKNKMSAHHSSVVKLLSRMKGDLEVAEVGVWRGLMTRNVLNAVGNIRMYHCVDCWERYEDHDAILKKGSKFDIPSYDIIFKDFKNNVKDFEAKINILRMYSEEAAKYIEDESLDLVFIDSNHAYEYAKQDISLWSPKIKKGGVISGHDYGITRFGVTDAVDEVFDKINILPGSVWWVFK